MLLCIRTEQHNVLPYRSSGGGDIDLWPALGTQVPICVCSVFTDGRSSSDTSSGFKHRNRTMTTDRIVYDKKF